MNPNNEMESLRSVEVTALKSVIKTIGFRINRIKTRDCFCLYPSIFSAKGFTKVLSGYINKTDRRARRSLFIEASIAENAHKNFTCLFIPDVKA